MVAQAKRHHASILRVSSRKTECVSWWWIAIPRQNATAGLGIDPGRLERSMYDVFMGVFEGYPDASITDVIVTTASGIDLALATLELVGAEPFLYNIDERASIVKEALGSVALAYDFILMDTPPSIGQFVINGLVAADHTVVTLDPGTFALKGIGALSAIFDDIREMLDQEVVAEFAILTRWRDTKPRTGGLALFLKRIFSGDDTMEERERKRLKHLEDEVKKTFSRVFTAPYSSAIYETQAQGLPISHYAPESDVGAEYRAIAGALVSLKEQ
jgi:chromosome partitioning protein